jgi:hypothetical protein
MKSSTEVRKPIPSYQAYKGTVFELVDQALDFVMSKIARRVGTRAAGPATPVECELPREVVAEAIVNAVAHRDCASNASVQVMLFADRLEVWNPGELPPPLTVERLRRPHPSIPHNPLIAEPLFLAGYIEKAGTGTLDMIARLREAGLAEPEFRQDGGTFDGGDTALVGLLRSALLKRFESSAEAFRRPPACGPRAIPSWRHSSGSWPPSQSRPLARRWTRRTHARSARCLSSPSTRTRSIGSKNISRQGHRARCPPRAVPWSGRVRE